MVPKRADIDGRQYRVLADRTVASFRPGDVIRVQLPTIGYTAYQYVIIRSDQPAIRATRRQRGLPFHRVPSVLVSVEGINGYIHFTMVEGRTTSGSIGHGAFNQSARFDMWKIDADTRWDIYRPIVGE